MTDAQIEAIARAYCMKMGLHPDFWVPHEFQHQWERYTDKAREAIAMREAINEVLGEKEGRG